MNKKELRAKFKKIREKIDDKSIKSVIIADKIINSEVYKSSNVIALYCSMTSEVDTSFLIEKSLLLNKIVVLPKIVDGNNLEFYKIFSLDDINSVNPLGIKEPVAQEKNIISPIKIDLMIVPGICFDMAKNRLGFGKGYYDRYLNACKNIKKVGICFYEQILLEEYIPIDKFDVKMDMVITDREILD